MSLLIQVLPLLAQNSSAWSDKTLVIVLPSDHKQIAVWEAASKKDTSNRRLQANVEKRRRDAALFAEELKKAFISSYDYSEFAFVFDSTLQHFQHQDHLEAHAVDGELVTLAKASVWYVIRRSAENGAFGLVLCNQDRQQIERPFPSFYRLHTIGSFLSAFWGAADHPWRPLGPLVEKMNDRLQKYSAQKDT